MHLGASDNLGFEDVLLGVFVLLAGAELSGVGFGACHPNLPSPGFCRRDNLVPIHIFPCSSALGSSLMGDSGLVAFLQPLFR